MKTFLLTVCVIVVIRAIRAAMGCPSRPVLGEPHAREFVPMPRLGRRSDTFDVTFPTYMSREIIIASPTKQ